MSSTPTLRIRVTPLLLTLLGACTGTVSAPPGDDPDASTPPIDAPSDDAGVRSDAEAPSDGGLTCDPGLVACAGGCVDPETSPDHCGGCGVACGPGELCTRGACAADCDAAEVRCTVDGVERCVDTRSDVAHCGSCGAACALPNGGAACVDGACTVASCDPGFADCNGDSTDGCETDVRSTPSSCGACGAECALANASATCADGACRVTSCDAGFADCNADPLDGCETDTRSAVAHCGACGNACPAGFFCDEGACAASCSAPREVCATECVDTRTSTTHCGGCGAACAVPNGTPRCSAGACGIDACLAGYGDCNGAAADGCEVDTRSDPAHCGGCGLGCSVANGTPACTAGSCRIGACDAGFADCNGSTSDGCETATTTSTNHCGGCGMRCSVANGSPRCTGGSCAIASCASGYADCNGAAADGCEVDTRSTVAHCGGCGNACPSRPNTVPSCASGSCRYTCASGFTDCNGDPSDGCEVNTGGGACPPPPDRCDDPIVTPPAALGLDPFYQKYLDAAGIPVLSSSRTSDAALRVACRIVRAMVLPRSDLRAAMIARGGRVGVMARDEVTTDIPEHADLYTAFPGVDWNTRARGLGATVARPITTCAEENLLGDATDPYFGENILVHELAHGIFNLGVVFTISSFSARLNTAFSSAQALGLWDMTYANTNRDEYFAEGVQSYFDVNLEASPPNGIHNHVDTRAELLVHDPALHALVAEIFPGTGALP